MPRANRYWLPGRAYNSRKRRRGAFWEDFYHSTVVEVGEQLACCFTYIDLNMVRAGVVGHPRQWREAGYREIQNPPKRYRIIDRRALCELLVVDESKLGQVQDERIEASLNRGEVDREPQWSEAIAVGRRSFVEQVKEQLGDCARYRMVEEWNGVSVLREATAT
jgi:putative transposase